MDETTCYSEPNTCNSARRSNADTLDEAKTGLENTVELEPYHLSANVQLVFTQLLYGQREAVRTRALRLAAPYPRQPAFCICPALAAAVEGGSLGANEHILKSMKLVGC